jgi:hypothetical protein
MKTDAYADAQCSATAEKLTILMGYRGLSGSVEWLNGQYVANGTPCGCSVHGVYDWMNRQPGVKP